MNKKYSPAVALPFLFLNLALLLVGCNREPNEKVIIQEKLVNPDINQSLKIDGEKPQIEIKKASLGKAFLIYPTVTEANRNPMIQELRPLIISFDKVGNRLALHNLTVTNLYSDIPSEKLLQTFPIIKETETAITMDISAGFKSMSLDSSLEVIVKGQLPTLLTQLSSGEEPNFTIKDSEITKLLQQDNSILVSQTSRIISQKELPNSQMSPSQPPKVSNVEKTVIFNFEIKPYIENKNFQSLLFDKSQKVGYFLNFAHQAHEDLPLPQISKWDTSPESGPIQVIISDNTPLHVRSAMLDAVRYWNRIFGKEVLKLGAALPVDATMQDRAIFIRWIPWDSAGFAVAGLQADPLTGEIKRAQISMTSSWLLIANRDIGLSGSNLSNKKSLCQLDQAEFLAKLSQDFQPLQNLSSGEKENVALDIVRLVIAHEMGHTLGLRHNFAGSFQHPGTDAELRQAHNDILSEKTAAGFPASTSVMDYVRPLDHILLGRFISHDNLSYDQSAIRWAYSGEALPAEDYPYCSDEHIAEANQKKASIYGCERFDSGKNVFKAQLESFKEILSSRAKQNFDYVINRVRTKSNFEPAIAVQKVPLALSSPGIQDFMKPLYSGFDFVPMASINFVLQDFLAYIAAPWMVGTQGRYYSSDSFLQEQLKADMTEVGGLRGLVENLLFNYDSEIGSDYFQKQQALFYDKLKPEDYPELSQSDLAQLREKSIQAEKAWDSNYLANLLAGVAPHASIINSEGKTVKVNLAQRPNDDVAFFTSLALKALVQRNPEYSLRAFDQDLKLSTFLPILPGSSREKVLQYLLPETYNDGFTSENFAAIRTALLHLKLEVIRDTLKVLKLANLLPLLPADSVPSSSELNALLSKVNWAYFPGIRNYDLNTEVSELEKIEKLRFDGY